MLRYNERQVRTIREFTMDASPAEKVKPSGPNAVQAEDLAEHIGPIFFFKHSEEPEKNEK